MVQMQIALININANKLLMSVQGFKEFSSDVQAMTSVHNSSELKLHKSLELRLHDHNNEQSTSNWFQKLFLQQARQLHHDKN
nr:hypothetical protein [Tanacetum cinerariifolium]